jgi:Fe-S cluster assembly protein SufD
VLSQPIQLLYRRRREGHFSAVHHLLRLAEGAEATVIETHTGPDDLPYAATSLTRIELAAGARLDHYKQQNEGNGGRHFGGLYVNQAPRSVLRQTHLALGSQFARTEIHSLLEEGSECHLEGSFVALNRAVSDTHTRLRHRGRAAQSREHYRGLATAQGRGIFQGRIIVEPGAQKTEAFMHSKNLLLSDQAEIDAKPQLEIHADDVRCAHGVSIGQIEPNQLFYLRSRGLDEAEALRVLTQGFVATVLAPVRLETLRAQMESDLRRAVERAIDGRNTP